MIDHISLAVSNLSKSAEFYEKVLEPLGLRRIVDRENTIGFGKKYPEFWINARAHPPPIPDADGESERRRVERIMRDQVRVAEAYSGAGARYPDPVLEEDDSPDRSGAEQGG